MKKTVCILLAVILTALSFSPAVLATDPAAFTYDLSCGGAHEVSAQCGDIIEITFTITRTDAASSYYANALQNYITYDETFFEFVDASCARSSGFAGLRKTLSGRKIYMTDMMDTLKTPLTFATFRLRVIGTEGSGWVRNGTAKLLGSGSVAAAITCVDLCVSILLPEAEITEVTGDGAAATIRNPGSSPLSVCCMLAAYDETGRLLNAGLYSGEIPAGERVPVAVSAAGIASAKLFLLDGQTLRPMRIRILLPEAEITALSDERAAAVVRNPGSGTLSVCCMLAAYDEAGRLLNAGLFSGEISAGAHMEVSVTAADIASVKLFLLDGQTGQPLCEAVTQAVSG